MVTNSFFPVPQETQADLQEHNELMKTVNEKGKLVIMMESCGTEDKAEVQEQLRSLNLRWKEAKVGTLIDTVLFTGTDFVFPFILFLNSLTTTTTTTLFSP